MAVALHQVGVHRAEEDAGVVEDRGVVVGGGKLFLKIVRGWGDHAGHALVEEHRTGDLSRTAGVGEAADYDHKAGNGLRENSRQDEEAFWRNGKEVLVEKEVKI